MLTAESVKSLGKALLAAHEKNKSEVSPATRLHAPRPCSGLRCTTLGAALRVCDMIGSCPSPAERC